METRKRITKVFQSITCAAIITALVGCPATMQPQVHTKSETELAVSAIKMEWLTDCEFVPAEPLGNQIGGLLQDYVDTAEALAVCMKRHNDFSGYMRPILKKERAK